MSENIDDGFKVMACAVIEQAMRDGLEINHMERTGKFWKDKDRVNEMRCGESFIQGELLDDWITKMNLDLNPTFIRRKYSEMKKRGERITQYI